MRKILILFVLLLPQLSFTTAHKFYVSVTDIEYNEKQKSLQIIAHVFIDDLEKLLKERYKKDLFLLKKGEHPEADAYVQKYFEDKMKISVNGKERTLKYIGKEYDNDELLLYIEVENVEPFDKIEVENTVLTDMFPEQKNIIKVENKGEVKSLLLMRDKVKGTLNFSK